MEIKSTTHYDVAIKATLRDKDLSLSAIITAPYADGTRTVTVTQDVFPKEAMEAVQKVLSKVLPDDVLQSLIQKANRAANEAEIVAARRGEL